MRGTSYWVFAPFRAKLGGSRKGAEVLFAKAVIRRRSIPNLMGQKHAQPVSQPVSGRALHHRITVRAQPNMCSGTALGPPGVATAPVDPGPLSRKGDAVVLVSG